MEHGASLPGQWRTTLRCQRLPRIAQESADQFAEQSGKRDVRCRVIGIPRPVTIHLDGRTELGSILKLAMGTAPVEHALCAHVRGLSWLCRRGSFQRSALSTKPFGETDLVAKDVGADLCLACVHTYVRLGPVRARHKFISKHGARV